MAIGTLARQLVAETVGTFVLVFTVGLNSGAVVPSNSVSSAINGAFCIAAVLAVSIYALGPVSGAHFNPAVTVSILISLKISPVMAVAYIVAQIVGAQAARMVLYLVFKHYLFVGVESFGVGVFAVEFLYTFVLCYVVLNVAASRTTPIPAFGFAIGMVIVAGGYAAGGISGGAFNPAVATLCRLHILPGYCAAEFLGAAAAAGLGFVVRAGLPLVSCLVSEFIGTFILVSTVGLCVVANPPVSLCAFAIGMSLAVMIFADAGASGAHFNPAVTLAVWLRGKISLFYGGLYIVTQLFAGTCAAGFYTYVEHHVASARLDAPTNVPHMLQIVSVECMFTTVLCLVVLCVATVNKPVSAAWNGLTVGLCVVAGGNAASGISGGHLNPAVSLGLAVSDAIKNLEAVDFAKVLKYIAAQLLGGAIAACIFRILYPYEVEGSDEDGEQRALLPQETTDGGAADDDV